MKIYTMKIAQFLCLIFVLTAFLLPNTVEGQEKEKAKKEKATATASPTPPKKEKPKKPKKKEKTIAELVKKSKKIDGLFTLYQDKASGTLRMLISKDQLNKEYIYFSQIANGVVDAGRFKGAYRGSKVFKIKKYFNKIEFVTQNTSFYFDPKNAISRSKNANMSVGNMASIKIEAQDKKKGLYLIKADSLFLQETFTQIKPSARPNARRTAFTLGKLNKGNVGFGFCGWRSRECRVSRRPPRGYGCHAVRPRWSSTR